MKNKRNKVLIKFIVIQSLLFSFLLSNNVYSIPTDNNMVNEYSFSILKQASAPKEVTVIRLNKENHGDNSIQKGILFTYKTRATEKVYIAGDFSKWKTVKMNKGLYGVWYYVLYEYNNTDYSRYKFLIDGTWVYDPNNSNKEDDKYGAYLSIFKPIHSSEGKNVTLSIDRVKETYFVEFKIYNDSASYISLIGDFNSWNPENDLLKKGEDNIWRLKKRLNKGKYRYMYVIDGKWSVDLYNKNSASNFTGQLCSLLVIE